MFGLNGNIRETGQGRRRVVTLALLAALLLLFISGGALFTEKWSRVKSLSVQKAEEAVQFEKLKAEYLARKGSLDRLRRKAYGKESASVVALTEEAGREAGVAGRIVSLRPLGVKRTAGYIESALEVRLERVKLNELVNFLYIIENHRSLLVVRDFRLKSRFDDPNQLDISMRVVRLKRSL
jgi:general secretion pathway protein M